VEFLLELVVVIIVVLEEDQRLCYLILLSGRGLQQLQQQPIA